jgi:hypothetical protein
MLAWARTAYSNAKARSASSGVPFDITVEDVLAECVGVCPALGIDLHYPIECADKRQGRNAHSPSLDRIVPVLGYVPGNIAVISARANSIKNDGSYEEVLAVVEWMGRVR